MPSSAEGIKRRKGNERKEMEKRLEEDLSISSTSSSGIPVFVFPSQMVFNATDRDHLRQLLTIYNPYDFPVRFKVLSTAPSNYTVIDPEGSISSKSSVDLIVRLSSTVPAEASAPLEDKIRVQLYDYNSSRTALGKKEVTSIIHFGSLAGTSLIEGLCEGNLPEMSSAPDAFQQLHLMSGAGKGRAGVNLGGGSMFYNGGSQHYNYNPNYVAVLTALACIIGLMLPTNTSEKDNSSGTFIPTYLHLTINQKLLIAYTLGLMTMVIFRPQ
jgi:hypothetical protein